MSDLDATFVNLDPTPDMPAPAGRDFTARLRTAIDGLPRGGTVWFPPGDFRINTPFSVPGQITLAFAPGARLVPIRPEPMPARLLDAALQIAGVIETELDAIFATSATAPDDLRSSITRRVGRVVLVGEGNPRVYVEWWGAAADFSPRAEVDRVAIEAALLAVTIDRDALTQAAPRPPLTLCMLGNYQIDHPIVIAPAAGAPLARGVLLEGGPSAQPDATISCDALFSGTTGGAIEHTGMLEFSRFARVELRGLSLHAHGRAETCLLVATSLATDRADSLITLSGCTFEGAREQQVYVRDTSASDGGAGVVSARVRGCSVRLDNKADVVLDALDRSQSTGLLVEGAFRVSVMVLDSIFDGYFGRCVRVVGARSLVSGCRFMTRSLDADPFPRDAAIELVRSPVALAPAPALTASGSIATTPSFLRVEPTAKATQPKPGSGAWLAPVLIGIVHRVDRTRGLGKYWPPAVVWHGVVPTDERPLPTPGDARVSLLGCSFEAPEDIPPTRGSIVTTLSPPFIPRVFVNPNLARVFNVATFREDARIPIGSFETSNRDVGRSLGPIASVTGPVAESFASLLTPDLRVLSAPDRLLLAWAAGLFDAP